MAQQEYHNLDSFDSVSLAWFMGLNESRNLGFHGYNLKYLFAFVVNTRQNRELTRHTTGLEYELSYEGIDKITIQLGLQ